MNGRDRSSGLNPEPCPLSLPSLVAVVGGGTMGRGIAQAVAAAGIPVILREVDESLARKARDGIEKSLQRAVEKQKITADQARATVSGITATSRLADIAGAGLVVEAIVENLAVKQALFAELESIVAPSALLATNTSALSVSAIAGGCRHPERVVGLHFFNPVPAMKPVEIIRATRTSDACVAAARAFAERIGKVPIEVKEAPGFVVNRLLIPYINEAARALGDGIASAKDIDTVMELGAGHPMGPLALADMIGIDIVVSILETLERGLGDARYRPCEVLRRMVAEGRLGRKSGRGFFDYGDRK